VGCREHEHELAKQRELVLGTVDTVLEQRRELGSSDTLARVCSSGQRLSCKHHSSAVCVVDVFLLQVREIKQQQAERAVDTGLEATTVARSPVTATAAVCAAPPADSAATPEALETLSWESVYVDEGPGA